MLKVRGLFKAFTVLMGSDRKLGLNQPNMLPILLCVFSIFEVDGGCVSKRQSEKYFLKIRQSWQFSPMNCSIIKRLRPTNGDVDGKVDGARITASVWAIKLK